MQRITVFGKGGIGKSTLSANLAAVYARRGMKVLLVGCDPKHDTTVALTGGKPIRTVVEQSAFMDGKGADLSSIVVRGRLGIDCVEAGGPEPGIGCAGRGIGRMVSILESAGVLDEGRYDAAIFDVLGDVVCGGFAAPLRQGFADKVVIVTSEEMMALYAANNIARAIKNYSDNGVALCGLVANLRDPKADRRAVERLAGHLGTRVLSFFKRDDAVREAEYRHVTLVEHAPEGALARAIEGLAGELLSFDRASARVPTPLSDEEFHALARGGFDGGKPAPAPPAPEPEAPPAGPDARPRPAPRPGPDVEKAVARQASLWEGDPGVNSQVWGDPEQWRLFFCDFETRRHARTYLQVRDPVVNVWHQDLECSYATPNYHDPELPSYFSFPWPRSEDGPREEPRKGRGRKRDEGERPSDLMTNLRDRDVVQGGGRRLDEAIGQAVEQAEGRAQAIVVHSTCVPTVIGDDATAMVARWQSRTKVPIVYSNPADEGRCADAGLELFKRLSRDPSFARKKRKKRAIALVGFPRGAGLRELMGLLEETGLSVHAVVMPDLELDEARSYLEAEAQVLYPNAAFASTYKEFFEPLPLDALSPGAPYGFEGTKRWLEAVAARFGLEKRAREVFGRAARPMKEEWDRARAEAGAHGLAFVVDAPRLGRLTDPALTWGVPLLRLLREMGFSVKVLCHGPARPAEGPLSFFTTPAELDALLAGDSFQAVYSEYSCDPRLAAAGKAQFSLELFELGLAGTLRALERLDGLCRWPFPRRYARFLGEGA